MMSTTEGELDIEESLEREEGEIGDSDVEEGTYIPLERPETFNPPSLVHMQIQDEPSEEDSPEESSGSDSDDALRRRPKRTKIRPRRPQSQPQQDKKNKYNIWCTALQEDLLTEDMVGCDVTKNRRYGVESYDYRIKYRLEEEYLAKQPFSHNKNENRNKYSNKRKHSERGPVKSRIGTRNEEDGRTPRILPDLTVGLTDTIEDVAKDITVKLDEEKVDLIGKIVQAVGIQKAIQLYKETQNIEANGGMLVVNGARRRTPGGIYFFLLKRDDDVSQDLVNQIFTEDRKETQRRIKKARAKTRQKVVEQLKQSLTDSELSSLKSRGEVAIVGSEHGSNPPPSPVTDARDCSSDTDAHSHTDAVTPHAAPLSPNPSPSLAAQAPPRVLTTYDDDDDYLEVMCNDDMDLL